MHAALRSSKDRLAQNQDKCLSWATCIPHDCGFSERSN